MTDEIKILCDELCSHAGLNKAELLSGEQRVITQQELIALANAFASRISHYNYTLETQIHKPHVPANLKKIWTATFGNHWGIALTKRTRNKQPVFFINYGAK